MKQVRLMTYKGERYLTSITPSMVLATPITAKRQVEAHNYLLNNLDVRCEYKGKTIPVVFCTPQDKADFVNHYMAHCLGDDDCE